MYFIPQAESYSSEGCNRWPAVKSDINSYLLAVFKPIAFFSCVQIMCLGQDNSLRLFLLAIARDRSEFLPKLSRETGSCMK